MCSATLRVSVSRPCYDGLTAARFENEGVCEFKGPVVCLELIVQLYLDAFRSRVTEGIQICPFCAVNVAHMRP